MFKSIGWPELIIILVIVMAVFGVGRLTGIGGALGKSIREFRKSVKGEESESKTKQDETGDKKT